MSDVQLVLLILTGKVCVYTIQKFATANKLVEQIKMKWLYQFFSSLINCNFCLGVWVYFFIASVFHVVLFRSVFYCPIVSELATGATISLVVHLFSIGFQETFGTLVVGNNG
jgi:hypothetical protein